MKIITKIIRKLTGADDTLAELKAINAKLARLDSCITESSRTYGRRHWLVTGHWNDR